MIVDAATAKHRAEHAGHEYFFCSARCRERFTAEPTRYLAARPESVKAVPALPAGGGSLWTCPMHPQIVRDAPGSCPICGMALEAMTPQAGDAANHELICHRWFAFVPLTRACLQNTVQPSMFHRTACILPLLQVITPRP